MKHLEKRITQIEDRLEMQESKPIEIVLKIVDCACQIQQPDKFKEVVSSETTSVGRKIVRSIPKEEDFECTCHMNHKY